MRISSDSTAISGRPRQNTSGARGDADCRPAPTHCPARQRRALGPRRQARAAFTLVEILIVVSILGILASLVVPHFTSAAGESRENSLKMDLHRIRMQIEIYYAQHGSVYPTLANFADQMTLSSNIAGNTAPIGTPGFPLGPYIQTIPANPESTLDTVSDGAVGSTVWYYDQTTGTFLANDSVESREF